MHTPGTSALDRSQRRTLQRRLRGNEIAAPAQRADHDAIKLLLKHYGLRTSLIRLKVIEVLRTASLHGQKIGVRGVHSALQGHGISVSFLSVREVLKRLGNEGVIGLDTDKHYCLSSQALERLAVH